MPNTPVVREPGSPRRRRRSDGGAGRPAWDEGGFTLFEVMVALLILVGVLLPTTVLMLSEMRLSANVRDRVVAANLVDQAIHTAETEAFSTLIQNAVPDTAGQTLTQTVGAIQYTINTQTVWLPESVTGGACDNPGNGAAGLEAVLLVKATATWTSMHGTPPVRADTIITPPVSVSSAQDGNIALQVTGAANQAQSGLSVTVTNPGGSQNVYQTDANGCLFLAYQKPGTYSFAITNAGWVDNYEAPTATYANATLTAGSTIKPAIEYDNGATIAATFSSSAPAPIGLPITIANTGLNPDPNAATANPDLGVGTFEIPGGSTSVTSMTASPVWVYPSGYQVYAGRCPDSNPAAVDKNNNRLYPTLSAPTVGVTAGNTSPVTIPLYPLTIQLSSSSQAAGVYSATVSEVAGNPGQSGYASTACGNPQTYQVAGGPGGTMGTTTYNGTLTAGMPLGHFLVTIYKNGSVLTSGGSPVTASVDITGTAQTVAVAMP